VAEGVENINQLDCLQRIGDTTIQGFYFSKPLTPEDLVRYVQGA